MLPSAAADLVNYSLRNPCVTGHGKTVLVDFEAVGVLCYHLATCLNTCHMI